jgi:oligopeptide transport system substrate-binding protein
VPAYAVVPPGTADYEGASYAWQDLAGADREAAARQAYAAAGYSADQPLRIDLVYDTGDIHERVALAVTAMWREVLGIETSLDKREWMYFLDTRDQREEWDAMRFAWFGDYNSPMTFLEIFESSSPQNLPGYRSLAYDATIAAAAGTTDTQAAGALMAEAESTLLEAYPLAPLYFFVSKHLVDASIEGFEDNIMDRHPSRFLRIGPAESAR